MNTQTLLAVGSVLVMILGFTPSTKATTPDRSEQTISGVGTYDCGGSALVESWTAIDTVTTFYDADGNIVRISGHEKWRGVITNPANGKSADDWSDGSFTTDVTTGTTVVLGPLARVTIPGYGIVWHDTGRVVMTAPFDPTTIVFEAGPHEYWHGEIAELCAAMA